jgi:hypothetical protein
MEVIDAIGGPETAKRIYKRMLGAVAEEIEDIPTAAIQTALVMSVESICKVVLGISCEQFCEQLMHWEKVRTRNE